MRRVNIGAKTEDSVLRSQTGAESSSHCFVEESASNFSTSAVAISSNATKVSTGGGRSERSGGGASLVDSRMSAVFSTKKSKSLSDVTQDDEESFRGESSECRLFQRVLPLPVASSMLRRYYSYNVSVGTNDAGFGSGSAIVLLS